MEPTSDPFLSDTILTKANMSQDYMIKLPFHTLFLPYRLIEERDEVHAKNLDNIKPVFNHILLQSTL